MITLAIVSPCYNEEDILEESAQKLTAILQSLVEGGRISKDSFVLYVNDGSKDRTWEIIKQLNKENSYICGLCLVGNVGHQNAIMAGMMKVKNICDAVITIDADIQDDLEAIPRMIEKYEEGNDVVYGVKVSRSADSFLKKTSAQIFYKLQNIMGIKSIYNHADYRLLSSKALRFLSQYPERNLYLRGIIPLMGLKSATVDDIIVPRTAGQSKYTIKKMLKLAIDGITSFSTTPIDLIIMIGFISLIITFVMVIHVLFVWFVEDVVPGWTELMISLWFIGSAILLSIGVIGEYIAKIYIESKHRPLYFEDEFIAKE